MPIMKRLTTILSFVVLALALESHTAPTLTEGKVFICENSKVYHCKKSCPALSKASFKTIQEKTAKNMGRRKCKLCYK